MATYAGCRTFTDGGESEIELAGRQMSALHLRPVVLALPWLTDEKSGVEVSQETGHK